VGNASVALHFGSPEEEAASLSTLALCDLSILPKLEVKGPAAEDWLRQRQVDVPAGPSDSLPLADGGLIVRLGAGDYLLEGGLCNDVLPRLSAELEAATEVYCVERHDATFLLTGERAATVLAQVCSLDFTEAAPRHLLLTRAAGVNCGILPDAFDTIPVYRFWVDSTYAVYFWETVTEIAGELGGRVVGAACLYPELR
jgi:sarcosine oxidase subunit gamma